MENVYDLAQVKAINMVQEIYKSFEDIGYSVKHSELIVADYGTPQKRRRLFFVAARNLSDFQFPPLLWRDARSGWGCVFSQPNKHQKMLEWQSKLRHSK